MRNNRSLDKYQFQIQAYINYLQRSETWIRLGAIFIVSIAIVTYIPTFSWIIAILIIAVFKLKFALRPKHRKAIKFLKQALDAYQKANYSQTLLFLTKAYELIKDYQLSKLISQFARDFNIEEFIEISKYQNLLDRTKDQKSSEILKELIKTFQYIIENKDKLALLKQKIAQLKKELNSAPSSYTDDIKNLINRYQSLIDLQQSKIDFYLRNKQQLIKLYNEYLYQRKLNKELEQLREIENQYLTESVQESVMADQKSEFIDYYSSYLKALAEYSDQINKTTSTDLFDEIIKEFEKKTSEIKK